MFIASQNVTVANVTNRAFPGLRLLEVTDLVTDIAIAIVLLPELSQTLQILNVTSLTSTIVLLILQKFITTHDSRKRKYSRLISVATLFLEDGILLPLNYYASFHEASVPFGNSFNEISETIILVFGLAVGGTVVVAKLTTLIHDAFYLEEIFEGDYNPMYHFLKEESGPQPMFLLSNDLWRLCTRICRPRFKAREEVALTL